jgi:hypothetical protein
MRVMRYAEILDCLDAEIDRLKKARDLLAGSRLPKRKDANRTASVPRKTVKAAKPDAPLSMPPAQAPVEIQRVPSKNRGGFRRLGRLSKSSISSTALSSHVPQGPVAVSANEAQKAREREIERMSDVPLTPPVEKQSAGRSLGSLIRAITSRETTGGLGTL